MKGPVLREEIKTPEATEKSNCLVGRRKRRVTKALLNLGRGGGSFPLQGHWRESGPPLLPAHILVLRKCDSSYSTASVSGLSVLGMESGGSEVLERSLAPRATESSNP